MAVRERLLVCGVHVVFGELVGAMDIACAISFSIDDPSTFSFEMGCAEIAIASAANVHG